ncbi:hypothetical protein B1J93_06070 [Leptospira kirschneri serovar Pomona]|uniref:Uncharacterized protein n=1 Tax=Leptospira kirschneri serovar Pomona TaxID=561005 RepID=A0A1T1DTT3_9LEPT|nr:hypothetical protein B1J93_06070 [Leptospira kirschneri serovar Pomona]
MALCDTKFPMRIPIFCEWFPDRSRSSISWVQVVGGECFENSKMNFDSIRVSFKYQPELGSF